MTTATLPYFSPVARTAHLDRLDAYWPAPESVDMWAAVHDQVQQVLARLDGYVRRSIQEVEVAPGRTKAKSYQLFTYRTFSLPTSAVDPVVVGLTFTTEVQGVAVDADVSGEQTGDPIFSLPRRTVSESKESVTGVAHQLANELSQVGDKIAKALSDSSRQIA